MTWIMKFDSRCLNKMKVVEKKKNPFLITPVTRKVTARISEPQKPITKLKKPFKKKLIPIPKIKLNQKVYTLMKKITKA